MVRWRIARVIAAGPTICFRSEMVGADAGRTFVSRDAKARFGGLAEVSAIDA